MSGKPSTAAGPYLKLVADDNVTFPPDARVDWEVAWARGDKVQVRNRTWGASPWTTGRVTNITPLEVTPDHEGTDHVKDPEPQWSCCAQRADRSWHCIARESDLIEKTFHGRTPHGIEWYRGGGHKLTPSIVASVSTPSQAESAGVQQYWMVHVIKQLFSLEYSSDWQQAMHDQFSKWIGKAAPPGTRQLRHHLHYDGSLVADGNIRIKDAQGHDLVFALDDAGIPKFKAMPNASMFPLQFTIDGLSVKQADRLGVFESGAYIIVFNTSVLLNGRTNARSALDEKLAPLAPQLFMLGLGNFAGVPIAYFTAKYWSSSVAYIFIPCLLSIALRYQERYMEQTKQAFDDLPEESRGQMAVFMNRMFAPRANIPVLETPFFPWPQWRQVQLEELLEYADPFLDAVQAGSAGTILSLEAKRVFKEAWLKQGSVGSMVASLGLEGTLTLLVAVSTSAQMLMFLACFWGGLDGSASAILKKGLFSPQELASSKRFSWLNMSGTAMELASLGLLAKVFNGLNLCQDQDCLEAGMPIPRGGPIGMGVKMFLKVFIENVPSAFITISLLGYSLRFPDKDAMDPCTCAVFTIVLSKLALSTLKTSFSIISSLLAIKAAIGDYMKSVRLFSPYPYMPWWVHIASLEWLWIGLLLLLLVKFLAVLFVCPSHTWSAGSLLHEIVALAWHRAGPTTWGCDAPSTQSQDLKWLSNCSVV